jgi:predicted secreted protein
MNSHKILSCCIVALALAGAASAAVNSSSSFEERIETAVKTIAPATLNLKYGDRDKTYSLAVGQEVAITLRANPKAGNVWVILANGEPALKLVERTQTSGEQTLRFRAMAAGTAAPKLAYQGPSAPAGYAFTATFNVR